MQVPQGFKVCVFVFGRKWPKVNQTRENWKWAGIPNLKSIPQAVCLEMSGNCLTNQRWWELNSVECVNKITRLDSSVIQGVVRSSKSNLICPSDKLNWQPGPDSRNDPLAIGSDTILWSWSTDRIPQTPITIGSSDRETTKPNSLLPIESWHKSFTVKLRIDITRSRLNEKCQTGDIYSWRHNRSCGDVIFVCRYRKRHGQFSARTQVLFMIERGLNMPCLTGMCM